MLVLATVEDNHELPGTRINHSPRNIESIYLKLKGQAALTQMILMNDNSNV